jgi:GrpB-like predicted nucleotidyltransferase (UPF0157 family)
LIELGGTLWLKLEHIGSTAVPELSAKPIIDMMGAVQDLDKAKVLASRINDLSYELMETEMQRRLFLR